MLDTPPPVIRISEQEALNAEAGWLPIATEPKDGEGPFQFLVTDDPTDPDCAHLVRHSPGGKHFNGDVIIESFDTFPTHWMPVPVAKKAGA
jgi:hypothetical protein